MLKEINDIFTLADILVDRIIECGTPYAEFRPVLQVGGKPVKIYVRYGKFCDMTAGEALTEDCGNKGAYSIKICSKGGARYRSRKRLAETLAHELTHIKTLEMEDRAGKKYVSGLSMMEDRNDQAGYVMYFLSDGERPSYAAGLRAWCKEYVKECHVKKGRTPTHREFESEMKRCCSWKWLELCGTFLKSLTDDELTRHSEIPGRFRKKYGRLIERQKKKLVRQAYRGYEEYVCAI
jgi:hypothetical protein